VTVAVNKRGPRGTDNYESIVIDCPDTSTVFWNADNEKFGLKWKDPSDDRWYQQWLKWSCRGSQPKYYRAMIALYKALKRGGVLKKGTTLRYLAG